jgi:serine/threonine protein phosphatase PrpC
MTETRSTNIDQPILLADQHMERCVMYRFSGGEVAVFSSGAPHKNAPNEDSAVLVPAGDDAMVLAVADGLGALRTGERASSMALKELVKAVCDREEGAILRTAILDGIEKANRVILELTMGSATTLAAVELNPYQFRPYHVGDSVILLMGQRGKLKLQTIAHSPVGFAVESGIMDEQEAMHHEDRHLVSNVIGAGDMRIEVGPVTALARRDTLLLASDGLVDNLSPDEIIGHLRKGSLESAANRLAADAVARMTRPRHRQPSKPDDLTFMVFRRCPPTSA